MEIDALELIKRNKELVEKEQAAERLQREATDAQTDARTHPLQGVVQPYPLRSF